MLRREHRPTRQPLTSARPLTLTLSHGARLMIPKRRVAELFLFIFCFPHPYATTRDANNTTTNYISAKLLVGQSIENKQGREGAAPGGL